MSKVAPRLLSIDSRQATVNDFCEAGAQSSEDGKPIWLSPEFPDSSPSSEAYDLWFYNWAEGQIEQKPKGIAFTCSDLFSRKARTWKFPSCYNKKGLSRVMARLCSNGVLYRCGVGLSPRIKGNAGLGGLYAKK